MRYTLRRLLIPVTLLSLVAGLVVPAGAQNPTGAIRGIVEDPQGAVIQKAAVTVTNKATGDTRKSNTGDDGIYLVDNLLPGTYEVKIEAQGFATEVHSVLVQVGTTTPGDFKLRVGKADEIVDVVAEAPIIDRSSNKIDGVVTRQRIDALPLNGRNFLQLALLEPGVSVSVSSPGDANNLFNVSIGGGPSALTRITVDGGSVLDPVTGGAAQNFSTETIQEFQISTFNFDLSTGITGVGAVNIVSRTGTNEYHGNAFLFFRDHALSALPTFNRPAPTFDPFFRRYQYGGSIGGPIKKDKLQFFANVEWLNQDSAISVVNTGFAGFRALDTSFTSPYDGILFNSRLDYTMTDKHRVFGRFSFDDNDAFAPVGQNQLPSNWRVNSNVDKNFQVGLNSILKQNVVNDLRFNYQRINNDSSLPGDADCPATNLGCIGRGGPEIRVNNSSLMLGNSVNAPQNRILDRYQTSDLLSWQKGGHRLQLGGELEHNYGLGGWAFADPAVIVLHDPRDVLATNAAVNALLPAAVRPAFTIPLPAAFTTPGATITVNDLLQLPIAVAVVGIGDPSQPPPFNVDKARRSNRYRWFVQDSWQIKDNFTFRYGVSYQFESNLLNHDLNKPTLIIPLVGNVDSSRKDKNNFAPSIGFNWAPGRERKTVIRGGAGVYYDTVLFVTRLRERAAIGPLGNGRSQITGQFFQNPLSFPQIPGIPAPFSLINPAVGAAINFTTIPTKFTGQNFLNLLNSQIPIIQGTLQSLGATGISGIDFFKTGTDLLDPNLVVPYSLNYNIGFARELPHNMAINADFVVRRRLHTLFQNDFNLADRVASLGGAVIPRCVGAQASNPAIRCSNGPISVIQSSGREQYTALLVKLDKRFSNRYTFTASYALSKLTGFNTGEDLTNWFGFHSQLGGDARHRFTFSGVVDLPWSFQASLIAVYASRGPFSARIPSTIDLNGDGTAGDTLPGLEINSLARGTSKADLVRLVNEFNANFAGRTDARGGIIPPLFLPTRFDFGDNFQSHDVRFSKNVKLGERVSLQGFVEVFNIFNISNLGGYTNRLDRGTISGTTFVPPTSFNFGQPTVRAGQNFGTGGPRAFQLGGRFTF